MRIAVVAPSSRFESPEAVIELAWRIETIAAARHPGVQIAFHPQCAEVSGHFAGTDEQRAAALIEVASDPAIDAIWFARGGYGSNRIAERALAGFGPAAKGKTWLGYSDAGFLLAGLYRAGYPNVAHGPMPNDLNREGGEAAVGRALDWLVTRSPDSLEPGLAPERLHAAFNITVLGMLLGTPLEPHLADHILLLEEVAEHLYATDRALFHIMASENVRRVAGIRLGRVSGILPNEPEFGEDAEQVMQDWCKRAGIPYLGRAEIGHDSANMVVPFGLAPPL